MRFDNVRLNLEHLAEEAAEVIQIKSKIVRFGLADLWPERGKTNQQALGEEVGNMLAIIDLLMEQGVIVALDVRRGKENKLRRMKRWYGNPDQKM